jgi:hypothetical protein
MSFLARRLTTAPRLLGASRAFSASVRRDIAKITLVGNLAATPEVKATSTGKEVIEYSVASSNGPRDNRHTSWFRVATFAEEGPRRDYLTSLPKGYVCLFLSLSLSFSALFLLHARAVVGGGNSGCAQSGANAFAGCLDQERRGLRGGNDMDFAASSLTIAS